MSSSQDSFDLITLPNGIRVAHREVGHTKVAHCGFIMDIGSRDELQEEQGLAHFWEHMAFKGTDRRKAFHVINRLDSLGGELNAYTTKEKICFYATLLDRHFEKAMELLADITFRSTFPEKEIEKEKGVVLEEMSMYLDSPEDAIQDDFEQVIFGDHPLGRNILGTTESVPRFDRAMLRRFIDENFNTEKMVFSSVGNIPFAKVKRWAEKYLGPIPARSKNRERKLFTDYTPSRQVVHKPIKQAHCMLGRDAFPIMDDRRLPFFMLMNILGGPGMNSRLNLSLREKHGLVYGIDASYTPFIDTGHLSIYFGTEKKTVERAERLVIKEIRRLKERPMGQMQLHTAKEQLMGQLAMSEESNSGFMLMLGKSLLDLERVDSLNSIFDRVRGISATELQDLANEYFEEEKLSFLTYLPE